MYSHKLNSINVLHASIKNDNKNINIGYDINYKEELD